MVVDGNSWYINAYQTESNIGIWYQTRISQELDVGLIWFNRLVLWHCGKDIAFGWGSGIYCLIAPTCPTSHSEGWYSWGGLEPQIHQRMVYLYVCFQPTPSTAYYIIFQHTISYCYMCHAWIQLISFNEPHQLTFYPIYLYYDILFGIMSGNLSVILSGILLGILSDILSGILSFSFWHSIWHIFWHFIWHSFWHPISHVYLTVCLAFYLAVHPACYLTFSLECVRVRGLPRCIRSSR